MRITGISRSALSRGWKAGTLRFSDAVEKAAAVTGRVRPFLRVGFLLTVVGAFCVLPSGIGTAYPSRPTARLSAASSPLRDVFEAVSRCRPSLSEDVRWQIAHVTRRESLRHGYDPLFVVAMMDVESGCSPTALGSNGGVGLIQIRPPTAREVAESAGLPWRGANSLTRPAVNVSLGLHYLAELEERFSDPVLAIAAYNLGPGRVEHMARQRARGARYVKKILTRYDQLLETRQARAS
jgi:soluble lytic murein transglycosylase-like protein